MKNYFLITLCLVFSAVAMGQAAPGIFPKSSGSAAAAGASPAPTPAPTTTSKPTPDAGAPATLNVEEILARLDLRGRLAQLMLVTLEGELGPNKADIDLLKRHVVGGTIIRQAALPTDAANYAAALRALEARSGIPLLVGCDLYSLARADRGAPSQFVQLPSLLSLAAAQDTEVTARYTALLAEHLRGMGFDFSLGPSLELAPTLKSARGSIYSFGSDPGFASVAGASIVQALGAQGVMAMPLGFPGGGANRTGKDAPVLLTARAELEEFDLAPYRAAIAAGARMLHVGNTLTPTIDDDGASASISPAVIRDLLRLELGYGGLVVAGPMDGADLVQFDDPAASAKRALEAGADMLYWVSPHATVLRVIDKLASAVESGALDAGVVEAAARRVLNLKVERASTPTVPAKEKELRALEGKKKLAEQAYEVERRAITLVKNLGVLPLSRDNGPPVGVTGVVGTGELRAMLEKPLKLVREQPIGTARHLGEIQDFEINRLTSHSAGMKTAIVLLTDNLRPFGQEKLIRGLKANGVRVVAVILGYPGNLPHVAEADAIILAYCDSATYLGTLRALADVILGKAPLGFVPNPGVLRMQPGQTRMFNALDVLRVPSGRLPVGVGSQFPAGLSVSYDAAAAVKRADWDFGDGKRAKGLQVEHAFAAPGKYEVSLQVEAAEGGSTSQQTFQIEVGP